MDEETLRSSITNMVQTEWQTRPVTSKNHAPDPAGASMRER